MSMQNTKRYETKRNYKVLDLWMEKNNQLKKKTENEKIMYFSPF
jgi:hypothetical protein